MPDKSLPRLRQIPPAAAMSIRLGQRVSAEVQVTAMGLLAGTAMVSSILISTALIIVAAKRSAPRRN